MNSVVAVILYGKGFSSSLTLKNLAKINFNANNLVIINNGPEVIKFDSVYKELESKYERVTFHEFLDNKSLAVIYNMVINNFDDSERFIFFDDDTNVKYKFFDDMQKSYTVDVNLQVPMVVDVDKKTQLYPLCNRKVFCDSVPYCFSVDDKVISIGSGLVIYRTLIDIFDNNNLSLFDERFALYGVDYSLFRRIQEFNKKFNICIQVFTEMEHSFSKTDVVFSDWRHREHIYDYVISTRYYSKSSTQMLLKIFKCFLKEVISLRFKNVPLIVSTFFRGHHPRCK